MKNIRVLIVDDHPLFRKGMRSLLESEPEITIIGEATNGLEAVELALTHEPDVVLMDLQMPDGGGLTATRELTDRNPDIRILVVTLFEDDDSIFTALRAGAQGYILKDSDEEEIMRAIRAVAGDQAIYSPAIAQRIIHHFDTTAAQDSVEAFPELTKREREILILIARGKSNVAIAEHLTISLKTIRNHVSNIYNKLQVSDRVQAAIRAREAGLK